MDNSPDVDAGQDIVVGRLEKNAREHVRVTLGEFRGKRHLGVRLWFLDHETGVEKPSGKGVNVHLAHVKSFAGLVAKAVAEAKRLGWLE